MYKVHLPTDQPTEKAVDRRRSAETARKVRIFNTRLRVMGIDVDALNSQAEDKKHQQSMEMQQNKAFDKLRKYHDDMLLQRDTDERNKRAALHTDLTRYWATQHHTKDSRDADLKCDLRGAVKITIPEGKLGPASMQIFQGDVNIEERKRGEQMKTERDLRAQIEDTKRRRMGAKHREMLVSKELVHQDLRGLQMNSLGEECKKAALITLNNCNKALAKEQVEKLKEQHRREEREHLAEMMHILKCDMMTERAGVAQTDLGGRTPHRVPVDRWKGMSSEQLGAIHREREAQRLERQRQRDADKARDVIWQLQFLNLSREAEEKEKRAAELRRERRIQLDHDNMQLAREQQAKQEYLNKELYTNKPTKDYFAQFNTTCR